MLITIREGQKGTPEYEEGLACLLQARPMTRTRLDSKPCGCGSPTCDAERIAYIDPKCHPGAGLEVAYTRQTGMLHIFCAECDEWIVSFRVASEG